MFLLENRTVFSAQASADSVCCSGAKIKPVVSTRRCGVAVATPSDSSESVSQIEYSWVTYIGLWACKSVQVVPVNA